jgi:hypothetical protein
MEYSNRPAESRLLCLPTEFHFLICKFLETKDVRAFRGTCVLFREIGAGSLLPAIDIDFNSRSIDKLEFFSQRPTILKGLRDICVKFATGYVDLDFEQYVEALAGQLAWARQLAPRPDYSDEKKRSMFQAYKHACKDQQALLSGRFTDVVTKAIQNTQCIDNISFTSVYAIPRNHHSPGVGERDNLERCARHAFDTVVKSARPRRLTITLAEDLDLDWSSVADIGIEHLSLNITTHSMAPPPLLSTLVKNFRDLKRLEICTLHCLVFPKDGPGNLEELRLTGLWIHKQSFLRFLRQQKLRFMSLDRCVLDGYWADFVPEIRSALAVHIESGRFRDIALEKLEEAHETTETCPSDETIAKMKHDILHLAGER